MVAKENEYSYQMVVNGPCSEHVICGLATPIRPSGSPGRYIDTLPGMTWHQGIRLSGLLIWNVFMLFLNIFGKDFSLLVSNLHIVLYSVFPSTCVIMYLKLKISKIELIILHLKILLGSCSPPSQPCPPLSLSVI